MYDATIHAKTIVRQLRAADFEKNRQLSVKTEREKILRAAVQIGRASFTALAIKTSKLRGKNIYQLNSLEEVLVVRHLTENIRRVTSVKQDNREFIVSCLRIMVGAGTPFRVYKFDIKSFYESVAIPEIVDRLQNDIAFSGQANRTLKSFMDCLSSAGVDGLPRGMSISATLAEYVLRGFDSQIRNLKGVWLYARFVDDIVVITDGREEKGDFHRLVSSFLPKGLKFNDKSLSRDFFPFSKSSSKGVEGCFDFLGYAFSVCTIDRGPEQKLARTVGIDISASKVRRIKTRIAKSLLDFQATGNYPLLLDRIKLLTSNYHFTDKNTETRKTSGIFFSYTLANPEVGGSLDQLDKFFRNAVCSPSPKNSLRAVLNPHQKKALLRLTFNDGFKKKRFFDFKSARLAQITKVWAYA